MKQYLQEFSKLFQYYLDKSTPHSAYRWIGTLVMASIYVLCIVYVQGFYVVSYSLRIYLLNLLIGFLSPLVDPVLDPSNSPSDVPPQLSLPPTAITKKNPNFLKYRL
ncbi:hypothetical protein V8G54_002557 [Vigna mungo]|uniref:Protein RER1 n=1 Tax=Vigna mungo TaxID=3915 RepID=A0AAQ3P9G9_VIGMU